jgi:general secretion pathway protein J
MSNKHRDPRGFTLIEIMIALTILAVLAGLLYGTFSATYRVAEQMEEEADLNRIARLGFYHIAQDLSMVHQNQRAQPATGAASGAGTPSSTPSMIFKGQDGTRSVDGTEFPNDSVQFTAVSHGRTARDAAESDRILIAYSLQDDLLIYEAAVSNGRTAYEELGERLQGLNFRYLDPAGQLWVDRWDSEEKGNKVPQAVEVEMILRNSRGKSKMFKTWVELPLGRHS